ncbi:MAG: PepSY domain-containing protein [Myxococcota bacterium]
MKLRFFRVWHANVGLAAAVLLLLVAVTGTVLAFRHELKEPEPASEGPVATVLTMDAAIATARTHANLADPVAELYLANDPAGTWCVVFADAAATEVYMRADGTLLAVKVPEKTFTRFLFELHTGAYLGPAGPFVTAAGGVVLVWLTVSGVWLKLPRKRAAQTASDARKAAS